MITILLGVAFLGVAYWIYRKNKEYLRTLLDENDIKIILLALAFVLASAGVYTIIKGLMEIL